MARFLVGVNYWPRSSGTAMWTRFDLTEVDEDFARIASLGLAVVRVFLTWDAFAPAADTLAQEPLEDFIALLDAANGRGLRVIPVLFFGHGDGVNRLPAWALDRARRAALPTLVAGASSPWAAGDFYSGDLLEAQRGFARTIGSRAHEHAALFAWDLGNAFGAVRAPASQDELEHWSAALTHDLYDSSNVGVTASFRPVDVAGPASFDLEPLCESWKFPSLAAAEGEPLPELARVAPLPGTLDLLPFYCAALAHGARHAAFVSSFGLPGESAAHVAPPEAAAFARGALERMQAAGALGALWHRWSDEVPDVRAFAPLGIAPPGGAYGLISVDGKEKPVARELAAFARERRPVAASHSFDFGERALREEVGAAFVAYRDSHRHSEEPT